MLVWCGHAASRRASAASPPNPPFQPTAAREIVGFLRLVVALAAAERQSVGRLRQRGRQSHFGDMRRSRMYTPVVQRARYAGVVRWLVVLSACRARRDRVCGVVPSNARYAGVIACWCGAVMRQACQRRRPARPTRRSSRPLRARDRRVFDRFCGALTAAERQPVGPRLSSFLPN